MEIRKEGYVTDIEYLSTYIREITPGFIRFNLLVQGFDLPDLAEGEQFRYMELGYGQGVSLNIHAASMPGEFWGTDFMPEHTANAQDMTNAARLDNVRALNLSFAELDALGEKGGLPMFDLITLHGVWSWVSGDNQRQILDVVRRHLKPGGAVYVSYNAMPGWASFMPIRELMALHAERKNADKDSVIRTRLAMDYVGKVADAGAACFANNPDAAIYLDGLRKHDVKYLAHEYLNNNWNPLYFAEVAKSMKTAGCEFVTSARVLSQADTLLPETMRPLVHAAHNQPVLRESLRDYALNQQFRTDIFVKNASPLPEDIAAARRDGLHFATTRHISALDFSRLTVNTPVGEAILEEAIHRPVLELLAENTYAPKSFSWLKKHPYLEAVEETLLFAALYRLVAADYISPAHPDPLPETMAACSRLNQVLCQQAADRSRRETTQFFLASPVTGGAILSNRDEMLFLLSLLRGASSPAVLAKDALAMYTDIGRTVIGDNNRLLNPSQAHYFLTGKAKNFLVERLPFIEAMGAFPGKALS